jgi:hypothetical protein
VWIPTLLANDQYCLSGGHESGFRCEESQAVASPNNRRYYSIQLLEQAGENELSSRADIVYKVTVEGGRRLVYLGQYTSRAAGVAALGKALKTWGRSRYPLLVSVQGPQDSPSIRLEAEPDPAPLGLSASTPVPAPATADGQGEAPRLTLRQNAPYELVYSIQTAVFADAKQGHDFAQRHPGIALTCREREDGLFSVYYGVYQSYSDARQHLQDYDLLAQQGAYIVRLEQASFLPCEALL